MHPDTDRRTVTRPLTRTLRRTALACASATLLFLGLAGSSQAATTVNLGAAGGLKYVRADGTMPQTVGTRTGDYLQAYCGNAWTATGGGVALAGDPRASYVSATDVAKYGVWGGGWHAVQPDRRLSVYGICSKSPAVTTDTRYDDFTAAPSTLAFSPACAAGHVLGAGVEGPYLDSHVTNTTPIDGSDTDHVPDDGWRGSDALIGNVSTPIMLIHYACGTGPQPAYRAAKVSVPAGYQTTLKAKCASGEHVSGGGVSVAGPTDGAHAAVSRPVDSTGDADKVPDDGWLATVSNDGAVSRTAKVTAICVS